MVATATQLPRWLQRRGTTVEEHLTALDNDADNFEGAVATMNKVAEEHKAAMSRLNKYAASILVSLATSTILLAINLVVK